MTNSCLKKLEGRLFEDVQVERERAHREMQMAPLAKRN